MIADVGPVSPARCTCDRCEANLGGRCKCGLFYRLDRLWRCGVHYPRPR